MRGWPLGLWNGISCFLRALLSKIYRFEIPFLTVYLVKKCFWTFRGGSVGEGGGLGMAACYCKRMYMYIHIFIQNGHLCVQCTSLCTCILIYTITWLLCAFSLVVDRDLLKNTHRWRQIHVNRLVFLFSCPKNHSISHLNFYRIKQIDYIFPCVCSVIDHRRRHSV